MAKMLGMRPKRPVPSAQVIEAQERQKKLLDTQEAKAEAAEKAELAKGMVAKRQRRATRLAGGGGMRLLLSKKRDNAELGLSDTLG
jgi:hypothetical protein